ncbi:hypothetical protein [Xanthomonas graminis]|uniref:hypothetical protein n=1 Tax=Xanthomonas graminis TaxID=3390026 RepID=UPI001112D174|nr:hypothetical protein [Xanthomonas translucens]
MKMTLSNAARLRSIAALTSGMKIPPEADHPSPPQPASSARSEQTAAEAKTPVDSAALSALTDWQHL